MKIELLIIMLISTSNLLAQDEVKNKIAELWWNNEIEIVNNRNKILNNDEAIYVIRNQSISTNCWSNFYRYTQNIQQSSGEQVIYCSLTDCKIIQENSKEFKVVELLDQDTGEDKMTKIFSYNRIDRISESNEKNGRLDEFINEKLIISNVLLKDTLSQLIDECHKKYSIQLNQDGIFTQGFENQVNCRCEINSEDFKRIHHIGFAKFNEANHSLLGFNGNWKIDSDSLYLKFSSGNIFKYDYEIEEAKLKLKEGWTTIELKKTAR